MKKLTSFFLKILILFSICLNSYGQNYIPFLKENHKYSIFNSTDSTFFSPVEYDYSNVSLSEKYIEVGNYINDQLKIGLLDSHSGKLLFPLKYNQITVLNNDLFIVSEDYNKDYHHKLIDKNQNVLYENFRGYDARKYFDSNKNSFRILVFENGIKIIDSFGKLILSKSGIKQISYLGNNTFNYSYDKELMLYPPTKWGIMDISGKIIFQPIYESISRINDNLFKVGIDLNKTIAKYAIIDLNGKELIPFNYYKSLDWKNGNIIIGFHENGSVLLDSKGKPVINKILEKNINKFYDFEFTENPKLFKIYLNNGNNTIENLIDINGNKLFKTNYRYIRFLDQTHLIVLDFNGKYYIVNLNGEVKYRFLNKNNNFRFLEDKKLICYQKINSPSWEIITFQGNKSDYFKLDTNIDFSRISNEIILSEDSTGISFLNLKGEKLFKVLANGLNYPHYHELESSKSTSIYEFSYPEKISNNFLTYHIGDVSRPFTVWYGISNKCEYSFQNKGLFSLKL